MARKGTRRTSVAPSAPPALIRAQPALVAASELMPLLTPSVASTAPSRPAAAVTGTSVPAVPAPPRPAVTPEQRRRLIAQAAFERAQRHGLGTTDPFVDWLHAEREVDARLSACP